MLCGFSKSQPLEGSLHLQPSLQRLPEGETTKALARTLPRSDCGKALNGVRWRTDDLTTRVLPFRFPP